MLATVSSFALPLLLAGAGGAALASLVASVRRGQRLYRHYAGELAGMDHAAAAQALRVEDWRALDRMATECLFGEGPALPPRRPLTGAGGSHRKARPAASPVRALPVRHAA